MLINDKGFMGMAKVWTKVWTNGFLKKRETLLSWCGTAWHTVQENNQSVQECPLCVPSEEECGSEGCLAGNKGLHENPLLDFSREILVGGSNHL